MKPSIVRAVHNAECDNGSLVKYYFISRTLYIWQHRHPNAPQSSARMKDKLSSPFESPQQLHAADLLPALEGRRPFKAGRGSCLMHPGALSVLSSASRVRTATRNTHREMPYKTIMRTDYAKSILLHTYRDNKRQISGVCNTNVLSKVYYPGGGVRKDLLILLANLFAVDIIKPRDLTSVSETWKLIHICSQPGRSLQSANCDSPRNVIFVAPDQSHV